MTDYKTTLGAILAGLGGIFAAYAQIAENGDPWHTGLGITLSTVGATVVGIFARDGKA